MTMATAADAADRVYFRARIDWRRRVRPILLVVRAGARLLGALTFWLHGGRYSSTENAFVKADIAQIASEVPGRIAEVKIRDHAVGRGRRRARAPRSGALSACARQGRGGARYGAHAAVEQLKASLRETKAEAQGSREPAALSRGPGQAPADLAAAA